MRLPKSRWAGVGLSVVVIAAVAGITLGATTLLGVTFQGSGSQPVEGAGPAALGPRVAICVQAVEIDAGRQPLRGDAAIEAAAKSSVESALVEVSERPIWDDAGYAALAPVVDIGCPSPPAVLRPGVEIERLGKGLGVLTLPFPCVEEASVYKEFVFILSPAELERIFGQDPELTLSGQETICGGASGNTGVTGGLYLTAADLDDLNLLTEKLKRTVGLWAPNF